VTFTIGVRVQDLELDAPHSLYVTLNAQQSFDEITFANNSLSLELNALPAPENTTTIYNPHNPYIWVHWDTVNDSRVAGYRIYRSEEGGPFLPMGSSFVTGFLDVNSQLGKHYRYAVAAYGASGAESLLSNYYPVYTTPYLTYLPLIRRK
jgi:fibronectin type 3 domain-containing protein